MLLEQGSYHRAKPVKIKMVTEKCVMDLTTRSLLVLLERAVLAEFCQESQNGVGGILNFGLHLSLKTFSELGYEGEPQKSAYGGC